LRGQRENFSSLTLDEEKKRKYDSRATFLYWKKKDEKLGTLAALKEKKNRASTCI